MNANTAYRRSRRIGRTEPNSNERHLTRPRIPHMALFGLFAVFAIVSCGGKPLTLTPSPETPLVPSASVAAGAANPSGLPLDWSAKAVQAASATIQICAQANTLQPPKCPQQIPSGGEVLSAQWKILDAPLAHAIAISSQQDPSEGSADPSQVTVFGRYQMSVSYTRTGQALRPFLDFAGGIARATMTWDGSSFQNVTFATYPVTDLPSGVCIAPFSRPPGVSDATALQLVQAGFRDCVTILVTPSMTDPPNCPQRFEVLDPYFVDLQVTLNGDPMHGALVTFDTARGDVAVTGSYSMTLNSTRRVPGQADDPQSRTSAGNYTAFLAWDGQQLQLLDIATT